MLADAAGPFNIMKFSLWIMSDVSDIRLPGDGVFGQKLCHDLFGKDDELLPFESLPLAQRSCSFQFIWILCKIRKAEKNPSFS
jgi:hypothetical protein